MTELDDRPARRPRTRRRTVLIVGALVVVVGLVIGLALFQPWKIFTRSTVDEAAPVAAAALTAPAGTTPAGTSSATGATAATTAAGQSGASAGSVTAPRTTAPQNTSSSAAAPSAPAGPVGGESTTSSASGGPAAPAASSPPAPAAPAEPVVLASGTFVNGEHATSGTVRVLQLADGSRFVRLEGFSTSDGPDVQVWVTDQQAGGSDWGKYDDGRYVELGTLKATDGNQNYQVPSDADLSGLTSVVIWCDRFNVAFGSAAVDL